MNQCPEICSRWKGRVYLKINLNECEYPISGVQKNKDYEFINTYSINDNNRKRIKLNH